MMNRSTVAGHAQARAPSRPWSAVPPRPGDTTHQGNVGQGSTPILVFDAWEHAFYLQYKNQKVDFIDAVWAVVNWQDVAKRYAAAKERGDSLLLAP
ncbi:hypothetical protein GCM10019016_010690 [Streptomyces prasinosporus]|uniref:superoxide dismutase n=1 Tax=Streptomyces prasinosporus TaxID=68256 RepID=A0ABP6TGX3_9ACTN|nr:hypothetical protein GCM10010332_73730 [Streptomyces albogriseolus]